MSLWKGVLKICCKFTGEHPCQSVISIKLLCSFIEITLWYGCFPVNLLNIFKTPFYKNISGGLFLDINTKQWLTVIPKVSNMDNLCRLNDVFKYLNFRFFYSCYKHRRNLKGGGFHKMYIYCKDYNSALEAIFGARSMQKFPYNKFITMGSSEIYSVTNCLANYSKPLDHSRR